MSALTITGDISEVYKGNFEKAKDFSQKSVRLFVSSTFTDTKLERNYLMRDVYPDLRDHYRAIGINFEVIDLRWGIRDEATDDHMTVPICMSEIRRCIRGSIGTFFVFLSGQKYGWVPLPPEVEAKEFELIMQKVANEEDKKFVEVWYKKDENSYNPTYFLQKISSVITDYNTLSTTKNQDARARWYKESDRLQSIFEKAVALCQDKLKKEQLFKWSVSVTAQEVINGGLAHPKRSLCFMRNISDLLTQTPTKPKIADFVNCAGGAINMENYKELEKLRAKVKEAFGQDRVWEYTVKWHDEGITENSPEHVTYVEQFTNDFKDAIITNLASATKPDVLPHPHTVEVLSHSHMCYLRHKIFRGRGLILEQFKKYFGGEFDNSPLDDVQSGVHSEISDIIQKYKLQEFANGLIEGREEEEDKPEEIENGYAELAELDEEEEEAEVKVAMLRLTRLVHQLSVNSLWVHAPKKVRAARRLSEVFTVTKGPHYVLVVYGNSGYGKTSVMAKAAYEAKKDVEKSIVIIRFCGTTPNSSTSFWLVESICLQLRAIFPQSNLEIPSEYKELIKVFPNWLALATADSPIVLFIDSLDQLNDEFAAELRWIPYELPPYVYLIVSTIDKLQGVEVAAYRELVSRRSKGAIPSSNFIEIGELTQNELAPILNSWLENDGKKLQPHQREQLDKIATAQLNPLFLRLLYDRASKWKSFSELEVLQDSVSDLINAFLERLETYHGKLFVTHVFGLLAASKYGLSVDELIDMISSKDNVLAAIFQYHQAPQQRVPPFLIARLKMDCGEYMVEKSAHGTTVLGWYHRQFWKTTKDKYFTQLYTQEYFSKIIASYFMGELASAFPDRCICAQPTWFEPDGPNSRVLNRRKLTELPHALIRANMGTEAVRTLADLQWVEASCSAGLVRELISDYNQAIDAFQVQFDKDQLLRRYLQFVKSDGDLLSNYPYLTLQQAINKPASFVVAQSAKKCFEVDPFAHVEWVDKPLVYSSSELTLKGHQGPVLYCRFAGKMLITCSQDKTVRVWNIQIGKQVVCYKGHDDIPTCCDIYEKEKIVASADKLRLRVWHLETGYAIRNLNLLVGRFSRTTTVCKFSSDGKRLVTATGTTLWPGNPPGAVLVWDTKTWKRIGISLAHSVDRSVYAVSDDCKLALVNHNGNNLDTFPRLGADKIELWDISIPPDEEEQENDVPIYKVKDKQVVKIVGKKTIPVQYFERKGAYFIPFSYLSKADTKCTKTWNITEKVSFNGNHVYIQAAHGNNPFGICNPTFSPSRDKQVGWYKSLAYVWQYTSKSSPNVYFRRLAGHSADICHAAFSPDEAYIATVSVDCTARIWQTNIDASNKEPIGTFDGKIRIQGRFVNDKLVMVIQDDILETHAWMGTVKKFSNTHIMYILAYAVSPDGKLAVTVGGIDYTVCLWDVQTGLELQVIVPSSPVTCIVFSHCGKYVIAAANNNQLIMWEVLPAKLNPIAQKKLPDSAVSLAYAPTGTYLAIATRKGHVYLATIPEKGILEISEKSFVLISDTSSSTPVTCIQFSPNGKILAFGNGFGTIFLYDVEISNFVYSKRFFVNSVDSLSFSEDGMILMVSSCEERCIRVINAVSLKEYVGYMLAIPFVITTIAVNSNGDLLAFDSNGKKYHMRLHEMNRFSPQTIRPIDTSIKVLRSPVQFSGEWFQVNKDRKSSAYTDAEFWISDANKKSLKSQRNVWVQGSILTLSTYLPASEYQAAVRLKLPAKGQVPLVFCVEGNFVNSGQFKWDLHAQKTHKNEYDLQIGKFVVVHPCVVTFKMESESSYKSERSGEYIIKAVKLKVISDEKEQNGKAENEKRISASKGDHIEFSHYDNKLEGTLIQTHGDTILVELDDNTKIVESSKSIVAVITEELDKKNKQPKISVIVKTEKDWTEASVYQTTEDSCYVMSIAGGEKKKYPISDTQAVPNLTPSPLNIKLNDVVLCKASQKYIWEEAVVVEINRESEDAKYNLYCLHLKHGAEMVADVRAIRMLEDNKTEFLQGLDSRFLVYKGLKDITETPRGEPDAVSPIVQRKVSKAQFESTIEQLFHHADVDKSGELTFEEVEVLSSSMGLFLGPNAWDRVLKEMDTNGNGTISKEELIAFWRKWYMTKGPGSNIVKTPGDLKRQATQAINKSSKELNKNNLK